VPKRWEYWLYPELKKFELSDRDLALRKAKDAKMDGFELMGLTLAVALTVALTKYSNAGLALIERIGAALANLLIAIPILMVLAGPFYVRRIRRALRAQLKGASP
jgi:cation transport ATPase